MRFIIGDVLMMRLDYDDDTAKRYLCFIKCYAQKEDGKEDCLGWIPLTKKSAKGNQMCSYLHTEEEIPKAALEFGQSLFLHPDSIEIDIRWTFMDDKRIFTMADGSPARIYNHKITPVRLSHYVASFLPMAEPMDEYIFSGGRISYNWKHGDVTTTADIRSSDELEEELLEKGAEDCIVNIRLTSFSNCFTPDRNKCFLVLKNEYFIIQTEGKYLLYDSYASLQKTSYITRAAKFHSEDEALEYVLKNINHIDIDSFEIRKITGETDYVRRLLPADEDIEEYSGKIEDSYPYMTRYCCEEPPF